MLFASFSGQSFERFDNDSCILFSLSFCDWLLLLHFVVGRIIVVPGLRKLVGGHAVELGEVLAFATSRMLFGRTIYRLASTGHILLNKLLLCNCLLFYDLLVASLNRRRVGCCTFAKLICCCIELHIGRSVWDLCWMLTASMIADLVIFLEVRCCSFLLTR